MSDAMNSHATAIKQAARDLAQGNIWATDRHIETIDHHADALAAELAEATARADALDDFGRLAFGCVGRGATEDELQRLIQAWNRVYPDDAAPGDTADGRLLDRRNRPDV